MAINKVVLGNEVLIDITDSTVTSETLIEGEIAYNSSGEQIVGTATSGGSGYTGHADSAGLAEIGWTDDDIAYYQANGVNWNEEDDDYHLVNDYDKQFYQDYLDGTFVLPTSFSSSNNFEDYYPNVTYFPKLDTSSVTSMSYMFYTCYSLTTIPLLDTSSVTSMSSMFNACRSLTTIPLLDTSSVTSMTSMFYTCYSLTTIPLLDTSSVTSMSSMFYGCNSLTTIPLLDTSSVTSMSSMFYYCYSLTAIPLLDTSSVTSMSSMFYYCYSLKKINMYVGSISTSSNMGTSTFSSTTSLEYVQLTSLKWSFNMSYSDLLTVESMEYMINNAQTVSGQTMTFGDTNLAKLSNSIIAVATSKGWTLA